ncbi:MAG: outer membrane lipoprotein chaperone LolA [Legionellaceae bacterium]|nr:outer membrane lipoprotein chaperone LolA [Legionellaceae bacterium]
MRTWMAAAIVSLAISTSWAQDAADDLQQRLQAMKSMQASFKQVVTADRREVSRSQGTMALKRPGKFRWDTKSPMAQRIVADGKQLWVYDIELEQVTVKKQEKGIGGTPALFLSGVDDTVKRDFIVKGSGSANKRVFDLKARSPEANFQRIKMIFQANQLTGLVLYDHLGQETRVKLYQIKSNPVLPARLFQFKPPRGVDVIRQ